MHVRSFSDVYASLQLGDTRQYVEAVFFHLSLAGRQGCRHTTTVSGEFSGLGQLGGDL